MTKLEELLEGTEFTKEEYQTYRKVEKHYQLEDLKYLLDLMLENNNITQEQYNKACDNADLIQEKYNKWLDYDWQMTMENAINYILEE